MEAGLGQRQFTFLHGCGRELQGGEDVIPVQVRIIDENFLVRPAAAHLTALTVTRVSRMQGRPLIRFGLTVIRS